MAKGYYRRQEAKWLHTRELIAAVYNSSANRDFKKPPVQGSDIYKLANEKESGKQHKTVKRGAHKGAIVLSKKKLEQLAARFQK